MIAAVSRCSRVGSQIRNRGGQGGWHVVGLADDGGEGGGGGGGEGGVDGDLAGVVAVEDLDAEGVVKLGVQPCGQMGHQVAQDGQEVQQVQVGRGRSVTFELGELGADSGAFGLQLGEPGQDPGSQGGHRGGGRGGLAGEGFDLAGVGVLSGLDLAQPLTQRTGGGLVAGSPLGLICGEQSGQQGAAFGPEDPGGEEAAQDVGQGVFSDADGAGVGFGLGRGGPGGVVGALVVGQLHVGAVGVVPGGRAGHPAHAPVAGAVPDPAAQGVAAPGGGVGAGPSAITAGAVRGSDVLRVLEHLPGDDGGVGGLG